MSEGGDIRVVVQQRALPSYRVPVYQELARREGIDLTLVYGRNPLISNVEPDGFSARHEPSWFIRTPMRTLYWHNAQWRYATRRRADVLILDGSIQHLSLVPALRRARRRGVPAILWTHGYSKNDVSWRRRLRHAAFRLASGLLLYDHETARRFVAEGFDADRLFVALNSLDQAPIRAASASWRGDPGRLSAFREEHDLAPGPVVLFVSRLEGANRLDMLLHAAADLKGTFPTLRVVIIGRGPCEQQLRRQIDEEGLAGHVHLAGPVYEESSLAPWFLCADVFCYPANIGLSLLHAFGYGLPVVTSDRVEAQNPEIRALRHGENGLLYADGDVAALVAALRQLIEQKALRSAMSQAALATVQETYTVERMVDGMMCAIRRCHANRN
jgi:glycosyltransferase involved in cell wall biosynthesis